MHTAGGGKGYTLTFTLSIVEMNIPSLPHCCGGNIYTLTSKYRNAGESKPGIGIFTCSQQSLSGIGIPASGSVRYHWLWLSPSFPCYVQYYGLWLFSVEFFLKYGISLTPKHFFGSGKMMNVNTCTLQYILYRNLHYNSKKFYVTVLFCVLILYFIL